MDLMSRTLNKLNAFLKGKRVMRTIPFKDLPKHDRDNNEFDGKYMIRKCNKDGTKVKAWGTPKPFVRVQVKNISEI